MSSLSSVANFERFVPALAELALRSLAVFLIAATAILIMKLTRPSAAARHLVWTIGCAAALAIPVVGLVMPGWNFSVPLAAADQETAPVTAEAPLAFAQIDSPSAIDAAIAVNSLPSSPQIKSDDVVAGSDDVSASVLTAHDQSDELTWRALVALLWAVGVLVGLAPLVIGSLSLRRLRQTCRPAADSRSLRMLAEVCQQLRIRRQIRLVVTDRRQIPMTWGTIRPIVLLPIDATIWPTDRLRSALLHELAHVERLDCLTQWIGQAARALYWFNPLAWFAVRELRREQEQACDDRVLRTGLLPADYAEHLLAVASQRPVDRFVTGVALAMSVSSRMDRRLRSILDAGRNRKALSRCKAGATTAIAAAVLFPLATTSVRFEAQAQETGAKQPAAKDNAKSDAQNLPGSVAELRRMLVEQYVTAPDEERVLRGAIRGMVESLDDPYTEYLPADELANLERQIEGKLTGIGAQLDLREGRIVVVTPLEGSPAVKAGVQPGDTILQIDGQVTKDLNLADAVKRIVGDSGTKVRLKVRRASGEESDLTIERGPIVLRSVTGFLRGKDGGWDYLLDRQHKIGYLAISQFGPRTAEEIKEAVAELKTAELKGLILDLRFSPGGLLQSAYEAAQLFLGEATVVTLQGRDGEAKAWKSDGSQKLGDFPLVVLAGERTASAAEVFVGALKDNDRARVVGARTFGKGSVQTLVKLDEGKGAIRLTTAFYQSPSGRTIDRRPGQKVWGIDPHDGYFVPMTQEATERLRQHRAAQEIVGGKPAEGAMQPGQASPEVIAKEFGDQQLAAALRTLVSKVVSGEFEKVGQSAEAAQQYALRRLDIDLRRAALTRSLEELDREWKGLAGDADRGQAKSHD